jgi:hypothetical protein
VHRLLKNTAAHELGLHGYALCSDAQVVTRVRSEGKRVRRLTAGARLRRRLQARYERLATLMPAHIPDSTRLPLAHGSPPVSR